MYFVAHWNNWTFMEPGWRPASTGTGSSAIQALSIHKGIWVLSMQIDDEALDWQLEMSATKMYQGETLYPDLYDQSIL